MLSLLCCLLLVLRSDASTHWVVTEDGRIQQQLESPFAMKKPEDLVTFMRQETSHQVLKDMKEKLLQEQEDIDSNEDKDTDLESRHYRRDPDCRAAGKQLPDFDLYVSSVVPLEHKNIEIFDYISKKAEGRFAEPNCTDLTELSFSIHAYDHLKGVQERKTMSPQPMPGLKATLPFLVDEKNAATVIQEALLKNKTSWVAYNLASLYWRMKGDANEAIECIRRALHYSPEENRDVALVNLANILHRAHFTLNATALMHHVIDISDAFNINYFSLANMYAVLGEYNESIYYYEETLEGQPDFSAAKLRLAAVKCQFKLQEKLEAQHQSLQRTLEELQKYKIKHEIFLQKQSLVQQHRLSRKKQVDQHMFFEHQRIKEGTFNHKCQVRANKSGSVLVCNLPTASSSSSSPPPQQHSSSGKKSKDQQYVVDETKPIPALAMRQQQQQQQQQEQQQPKHRGNQQYRVVASASEIWIDPGDEPDKLSSAETQKPDTEQVEGQSQGSNNFKNYYATYDWRDPSWPPQESCDKYVDHYPAWDEFPSAYVDPETRGFSTRSLLTSYIGIEEGEMHPTPWEAPDCARIETIAEGSRDSFIGIEMKDSKIMFKQDTYLQNYLMMHVNQGRVWPEDLGQRITTALHKSFREQKNDNLWVLYNLAALYWRVNGNNTRAVECLRLCVIHVPPKHSDVPLVSLSNIMYRVGKLNDAVNLLIYALRVNNSEPTTYLSMGNALHAQDNITGAVEFYNYAMVLHPQYREAFHALLVVKCYNLKQQRQQQQVEAVMSSWKNNLSETNHDKATQTAPACGEDDEVCFRGNKKPNGDEKVKPNETPTEDEIQTEAHSEQVEEIAAKLREEKSDASELLKDTDDVISELINSQGTELDDKLLSAKRLMQKLSDMRNSLGNLVHEAANALDIISSDDDDTSEIDCDQVLSSAESQYVTDSNDEFWNLDFSDSLQFDGEEGYFDPTCRLESQPTLYDVADTINVISRENFANYSSDPSFIQNLRSVIKGGHSIHEMAYTLAASMHSSPTQWKVCMLVSYFWRAQGDAREVVNCLLRSLNLAPKDGHHLVLFSLADFLARLRHFTGAARIAQHALSLQSSSVALNILASNIYAASSDYAKAKQHLEAALIQDKDCHQCRERLRLVTCLTSKSKSP